jgi:hypothetical protein
MILAEGYDRSYYPHGMGHDLPKEAWSKNNIGEKMMIAATIYSDSLVSITNDEIIFEHYYSPPGKRRSYDWITSKVLSSRNQPSGMGNGGCKEPATSKPGIRWTLAAPNGTGSSWLR